MLRLEDSKEIKADCFVMVLVCKAYRFLQVSCRRRKGLALPGEQARGLSIANNLFFLSL